MDLHLVTGFSLIVLLLAHISMNSWWTKFGSDSQKFAKRVVFGVKQIRL